MHHRYTRLVATLACIIAGANAEASPYTATRVGDLTDSYFDGSRAINRATGASYAFELPKTADYAAALWAANQLTGLPSATAYQGTDQANPVTYGMIADQSDAAGTTVLGRLPQGGAYSIDPMTYASNYGFTTKQADGTYSPFHIVAYNNYAYEPPKLSESNQILVNSKEESPSIGRLIDVATGTTTPVRDLVPPALMDRYTSVKALEISKGGDLLVELRNKIAFPNSPADALYILSPQGVEQAAPVPEPSTAWIAAAVAAGIGLRSRLRRAG